MLLSKVKEYAGLERAGLSVAFNKDSLQGEARSRFLLQLHAQQNYFSAFESLATPAMMAIYEEENAGPLYY